MLTLATTQIQVKKLTSWRVFKIKRLLKSVFTFFTRVHLCLLLQTFLYFFKHLLSVSVVASSLGLRDTAPFNWLICKMLLCSFLPFCFIHFIHHFSCLLLATITASVQVSMQIKFETLANVMFRIVHLLKKKDQQHSWDVLPNGNFHVLPKTCFRTLLQNELTAMYMLRILASDVPPCMVWLSTYFIQSEISIHSTCNNLICC